MQTQFLYDGFLNGFSIGYQGPKEVQLYSANLRIRVGSPTILWNKVIKEVRLGRFAGPFVRVPFDNFIQSPIGLVPKDQGRETRLIFHLSYPRDGKSSVNINTPAEFCTVKYTDFDQAIKLCLELTDDLTSPIFLAKSDVDSAFRNLGLSRNSWNWTVLKALSPIDNCIYYFVDKCLPFGSSISCALFQKVSDALAFLVKHRTKKPLINYLDDYLFAALLKAMCDSQVHIFMQTCNQINLPVSLKKTRWSSTRIIFLGFLIDGVNRLVLIPIDKIHKANELINEFLTPGKRKTTVHRLQQLCGFFNFLSRCVVPGRAFTRRMYAPIKSNLKPHHHIRISGEMRMDLRMWQQFLAHPSIFCRPFTDFSTELTAKEVDFYTDSAGRADLGGGGVCGREWFFVPWETKFVKQFEPSIEYLELYSVTVGIVLWLYKFANQKIILFCDNQAVVNMLNHTTSSCRNCMTLIRIIVLQGLKHNVVVRARFIRSKQNSRADAISRKRFQLFHQLSNYQSNEIPCEVPQELIPMSKLWIK